MKLKHKIIMIITLSVFITPAISGSKWWQMILIWIVIGYLTQWIWELKDQRTNNG